MSLIPSPLVSILIPCYNSERWISQAIESAIGQSYQNKEVIVVDDGSTDNSLKIIKQYSDKIRWETGVNQGGNSARNRLLELSTGEWLQYLDADDYLLPYKIQKQIDYLSNSSKTDILFSPTVFEYFNQDIFRQEILPIPEPHDPWVLLARWHLPQTGSPLWRKQAIEDVGGWKVDQPCCQEHELYFRLLTAGKRFTYFGEVGSVYRQWSESTTCKRNKSETHRQLLLILDNVERHLKVSAQLTSDRLNAINQTRFENARMIWLFDHYWANQVVLKIKETDINFIPSGRAAPKIYQFLYRVVGFSITENVSSFKRLFTYRNE